MLRLRAFLMTICWLVIDTPDWFTFECALTTVDYIFEAVNLRPDGKRPTIQCLNACYLSMFGEYATVLQNDGTSLEAWLKDKVNWRHFWSESIVSFENVDSRGAPTDTGSKIPSDLVHMVKQNNSIVRGLQSAWDKNRSGYSQSSWEEPTWEEPVQEPRRKKKRGGGGGRGRGSGGGGGGGRGTGGGGGGNPKGGKGNGKQDGGGKRQVHALSTGQRAFANRKKGR